MTVLMGLATLAIVGAVFFWSLVLTLRAATRYPLVEESLRRPCDCTQRFGDSMDPIGRDFGS